jgi:molecular chaperone GrpE (heat shock protein)
LGINQATCEKSRAHTPNYVRYLTITSSIAVKKMITNLERILDDLSRHHRDKSTVMTESVDERLSKAVEVYYKELMDSLEYLSKKNSARVLRGI